MQRASSIVVIGGTGQVGGAVVRQLAQSASINEVVMVLRRKLKPDEEKLYEGERVKQVVLDTSAAEFADEMAKLCQNTNSTKAVSCVGVGSGSNGWTEDALIALEVGVVGNFLKGCLDGGVSHVCLLSSVGADETSSIQYARVMGKKEENAKRLAEGKARLAIFRPGIIGGNAHTPSLLGFVGRIIPGGYGTIEQDEIAQAFRQELESDASDKSVVILHNSDMRQRCTLFKGNKE